jgi:hypothetical protein
MAGLDLFAVQEEIAAHIRATFPSYDVVEDDVVDDEYILRLDNNVKPFIFLRWGNLNRLANNASFGGVRFDEYVSSCDVSVVAPSPRISRKASNMINDLLIGWKLSSGTRLTPTSGSATWAVVNNSGRPHLYVTSMRFGYALNAESVGENITP